MEGRNMRLLNTLTIIFIFALLPSCGNYLNKKIIEPTVLNKSEQDSLKLDFTTVKEAIFSPKCISCHQQYDNYQSVIRELTAIQSAVASNRMPKSGSPLTDIQKNMLSVWIKNGAPEQAESISQPNIQKPLEPTWKSLSENVIFPKCLVCHNPQGQAKFLDISSRQVIFENRNRIFAGGTKLIDFDNPENSYLIEILKDDEEPMPPIWSNITRLNEDELKNLTKWLSLGLP